MIRTWTDDQKDFLRENYKKLSYAEIAGLLGKPVGHVKSQASNLHITVTRAWPEKHLQILRELYADTSTQEIADQIGRKLSTVYSMAKNLGLQKSEEFQNSPLSGRLTKYNAEERGGKYRFQKGQISHNKGLRRPGYAPGRMAETQFKKGHTPHNALPIGTEIVSTDGYRKIKIAEPDIWEFVHRRTWEQQYGPIPHEMMIRFRDGDKLNCDVENLMLVTKTDNALYNSIWDIPEEVVPAMAALAELKKELRNAEKQNARPA